jgi:hypothetical protein
MILSRTLFAVLLSIAATLVIAQTTAESANSAATLQQMQKCIKDAFAKDPNLGNEGAAAFKAATDPCTKQAQADQGTRADAEAAAKRKTEAVAEAQHAAVAADDAAAEKLSKAKADADKAAMSDYLKNGKPLLEAAMGTSFTNNTGTIITVTNKSDSPMLAYNIVVSLGGILKSYDYLTGKNGNFPIGPGQSYTKNYSGLTLVYFVVPNAAIFANGKKLGNPKAVAGLEARLRGVRN